MKNDDDDEAHYYKRLKTIMNDHDGAVILGKIVQFVNHAFPCYELGGDIENLSLANLEVHAYFFKYKNTANILKVNTSSKIYC